MALPKIFTPNRGFTLIEILLAVGLSMLLAGTSTAVGLNAYRRYSFNEQQNLILSLLQKVRSQSLNNFDNSSHGLFLTTDSYVLFEGASYLGRDNSKDVVFPAAGDIGISEPTEIVFSEFSATTTAASFSLSDNISHSATFNINNEGQIDLR